MRSFKARYRLWKWKGIRHSNYIKKLDRDVKDLEYKEAKQRWENERYWDDWEKQEEANRIADAVIAKLNKNDSQLRS